MSLPRLVRPITKRLVSSRKVVGQLTKSALSSSSRHVISARKSIVGLTASGSLRDEGGQGSVMTKRDKQCVVNSHTEWDLLEEVIVGRVDGATIPEWHVSGQAVWPAKHWDMFKTRVGQPFPRELLQGGENWEG